MLPILKMKHLNSGECADIYEIDNQTVLKLGKPGWRREMLYQEYLNGKLISEAGIPAPKVYDFIETEGRFGYTMDKLKDVTFLDLIWKHPWKFIKYAKKMASIHAKIHSVTPPEELPHILDKYTEFICSKSKINDNIKELIIKDLEELSTVSESCICHGDFHPINILTDEKRHFVIDWVLATCGPAEADVAGTYLITRVYSSSNKKENFIKRFVSTIGGKALANIYLKEYISITGMDKQNIMRWIPIRAATYIDVGLPTQLERILQKIIDKQYNLSN